MRREIAELRLEMGRMQARQLRAHPPSSLAEAEFRVFSQFGEDGILQHLVSKVGPLPDVFVEFGVEDYTEANTLLLLLKDNWRGLILDGSEDAIASVREREMFWRHDLSAIAAFVTRENVNSLISGAGFDGEIGVLSIDIDGNDYWVWEGLDAVEPVIVVAEYNSLFGAERAVSVPYDPSFQRTRAHHSNLYWGCSLPALCHIARQKGYVLVGSNSAGNNAFFVREGREADLPVLSAERAHVVSRYRESRDAHGALTFLSGADRLRPISLLPLVDVTNGRMLRVADL